MSPFRHRFPVWRGVALFREAGGKCHIMPPFPVRGHRAKLPLPVAPVSSGLCSRTGNPWDYYRFVPSRTAGTGRTVSGRRLPLHRSLSKNHRRPLGSHTLFMASKERGEMPAFRGEMAFFRGEVVFFRGGVFLVTSVMLHPVWGIVYGCNCSMWNSRSGGWNIRGMALFPCKCFTPKTLFCRAIRTARNHAEVFGSQGGKGRD